nr:hypothetical protein [Tanacetum cinerariifolium]
MDEFKKFAAKEGESLESVYERLTTLVNIMDHNNVHHILVSINTKFLNFLQPEWSKYVTMDGRVDIQTKNASYGETGNRNARRQNMNQAFNEGTGNDEIIMMARIQSADDNIASEPSYVAKAVSELAKKAFKERENRYLENICDLEEKLSPHDRIVYKTGQLIQTINMLGKEPNKVYDPFLKRLKKAIAGLGYKNLERLKITIAAQPTIYDGEMLHSTSLKIDSSNSSNSVRRPKSKDNQSKDRVLKNTNDKKSSTHVRKMSSSVSIDSNKRETMHLNVGQSNASVLNIKTINAVNDSSNIVCVSCGKDMFLPSHEKCVARYALSRDSKQSLDMEIMFKAISRYVTYTMLKASDMTYFRSENFVMEP